MCSSNSCSYAYLQLAFRGASFSLAPLHGSVRGNSSQFPNTFFSFYFLNEWFRFRWETFRRAHPLLFTVLLSFDSSLLTFEKVRCRRVQGGANRVIPCNSLTLLLYPLVVALPYSGRCEARGFMGCER